LKFSEGGKSSRKVVLMVEPVHVGLCPDDGSRMKADLTPTGKFGIITLSRGGGSDGIRGGKAVISEESKTVAASARRIYESQLREELERKHLGEYACIEPVSGRFFLGNTFDQAVSAALDEFPTRLTHTLRIGHPAALHLGVLVS
jgi:hypothetical protein